MRFDPPLEEGRLLRRYKRFLADIETANGEALTIHCPNTGSMLNCKEEGGRVWFSRSTDPKRRLPGTWELSETPQGRLACVNTARANALVEEALRELGFRIAVEPEGAFYLYADISAFGGDAFAFCRHFIETEHVAFTPGVDFGRHQAGHHVRFAYTQSLPRLEEAVARIARGLQSWRPDAL